MSTHSYATTALRPGLFRELREHLADIGYDHKIVAGGNTLILGDLGFVSATPSESGVEDAHPIRLGENKVMMMPCITDGLPTLMLKQTQVPELTEEQIVARATDILREQGAPENVALAVNAVLRAVKKAQGIEIEEAQP